MSLSKSGSLKLQNRIVQVVPLETEYPDYTCAVEVIGVPKNSDVEMLKLACESRRINGGPIEDIYVNQTTGHHVLTYERVEGMTNSLKTW